MFCLLLGALKFQSMWQKCCSKHKVLFSCAGESVHVTRLPYWFWFLGGWWHTHCLIFAGICRDRSCWAGQVPKRCARWCSHFVLSSLSATQGREGRKERTGRRGRELEKEKEGGKGGWNGGREERERGGRSRKLGNEWTEGGMGLVCDIISLSYGLHIH